MFYHQNRPCPFSISQGAICAQLRSAFLSFSKSADKPLVHRAFALLPPFTLVAVFLRLLVRRRALTCLATCLSIVGAWGAQRRINDVYFQRCMDDPVHVSSEIEWVGSVGVEDPYILWQERPRAWIRSGMDPENSLTSRNVSVCLLLAMLFDCTHTRDVQMLPSAAWNCLCMLLRTLCNRKSTET